ncbi:unnamed protein product [Dibothriocephalus latus]|uniref:Uncharacterized protein n=1 Tax=Dibothriocephalus latus TaxID=60516 RepID=A0A3P7L744_DIBLA|nr:unnamed protein product [Dibothriocephalus latus]
MYSSGPYSTSPVYNRFSERFEKDIAPISSAGDNPVYENCVSSIPSSQMIVSHTVGLPRQYPHHWGDMADNFQELPALETALRADQYNSIESAAAPEARSAKISPYKALNTWNSWDSGMQLTPGSVERYRDLSPPSSDSGLGDSAALDCVKISGGTKEYLYYGLPISEVGFYLTQFSPRR